MKYNRKIIAITGSIATGKSTISKIIKENGFTVIDADKVGHNLMKKDEINYKAILNSFGDEILDEKKEIDRKKLANIVFNDDEKLLLLNNLTHENIFNKIDSLIYEIDGDIVFLEIALLFEGFRKYIDNLGIDEIWLAYTSKNKQLERLMKRNSLSKKDAKSRINSQIDIVKKIKLSDVVFENDKNIEYLKNQVEERLKTL